jgi:hypothetical protein
MHLRQLVLLSALTLTACAPQIRISPPPVISLTVPVPADAVTPCDPLPMIEAQSDGTATRGQVRQWTSFAALALVMCEKKRQRLVDGWPKDIR